jgi:putative intracellular protease/amidase
MNQKRTSGMVAILVTDGFEQVELTHPRAALEKSGFETEIVSPKPKTVRGMVHAKLANAGTRWANKKVVVDGGLVTSRKPADIPAFNGRMLRAFGSRN